MHKLWVLVFIGALGCSSPGKSRDRDKPDIPTQVDAASTQGTSSAGEDAGSVTNCIDAPSGTPCDDGNLCTLNDVCEQGACVGSENRTCNDEGPCRIGECEPETGCQYSDAEENSSCQVACFSQATCEAGECKPKADSAIQCPKPDKPCVDQLQCNTETGKCTVEILKPKDTSCNNDGDTCTFEICTEDGQCKSTGKVEKCKTQQQNNLCWTYTCNKKTGCTQTSFFEGGSCDDGNDCSINDTCQVNDIGQKLCIGTPIPIDDNNPCTSDSCKDGQVLHKPIDGASCEKSGVKGTCKNGLCKTAGCTAVDGGWSEWVYGPCSKPCGGGTQAAGRMCNNPVPYCGGKSCEGVKQKTVECNTQPCQPGEDIELACPPDLPFEGNVCKVAQKTPAFSKISDDTFDGDTYGVSLVRGPGNTVVTLFKQKEWFARVDEIGNIILPPIHLPTKNPSVHPTKLGQNGWPAFYGSELATNGEVFAVARTGYPGPDAYFYTVDVSGQLVHGPLTIKSLWPGKYNFATKGPALSWGGDAWYLTWDMIKEGTLKASLQMARILPDGTLDNSWAQNGVLSVMEDKHALKSPEMAINAQGNVAAIVSSEGYFGIFLVNLKKPALIKAVGANKAIFPGCNAATGSGGDGPDVVWNDALGEFGLLFSGQATKGGVKVKSIISRLSVSGEWIGQSHPVACGYWIGAGHSASIVAKPNGNYVVTGTNYVGGTYGNGTSIVQMTTIDPVSGALLEQRTLTPVATAYAQTDSVYNGLGTVAVVPFSAQYQAKTHYLFE